MKFLFQNKVIFDYATGNPDAVGGAERMQWFLARALAHHGQEVVVYTKVPEQQIVPREQVIDGVAFRWISPLAPLRAWPKILAREKPDWWIWQCADFHLGVLAPLAHAYGTKVAYACALDLDCFPRRALSQRQYFWPLYALGLWLSDRILTQHERQSAWLPRSLQGKAYWVPNLVGTTPAAAHRENYVAWVAVMKQHKRPHLIAEIARKLPEVQFVVCGPTTTDRTQQSYNEHLLQELDSCPNLDYRGQVRSVEAQKVISRAAVFLSTSELEGFPSTFLHAWEAGVPVVSVGLDPGGAMQRNGAGIVAPDVDEAAKAIRTLVQDRALNEQIGQKGIAYIQAFHSEDFVVERLMTALKSHDHVRH